MTIQRRFRTGWRGVLAVAVLALSVTGCAAEPRPSGPSPQTVLIWISVDGMRHDYTDKAETPFLDKLIREGAHTRELIPVFPSLTFPSHVSQATGVKVRDHGVPLNSFYDAATRRTLNYPGFPSILEAEPIWTTAKRQGVRVAVSDWVLSHAQLGPHVSDYFGERYQREWNNRQRLQILLDVWREDQGKEPLRLLMSYQDEPDKAGHEYGPNSPEVAEAMRILDADLEWFVTEAVRLFDERMTEKYELYIFITTDHGMSEVHTFVHPDRLTGLDTGRKDIVIATAGNILHLHVDQVKDPEEREALLVEAEKSIRRFDFARAYRRDNLPAEWAYYHPTRVGDMVIYLKPGYTFNRRTEGVHAPRTEGMAAMHGYDPREDPDMNGFAVFWRYPNPLGGRDLGRVHSLQLHPTAAAVLGIDSAEAATADPIRFE